MEPIYTFIKTFDCSIFWIAFALFGSTYFSINLIPSIIKIAHKKKLMAKPCNRSSHTKPVPTLGGVSIFMCVTSITILYCAVNNNVQLTALLLSLILLFFLGVNDDLMTISPKTKFIGQLLVSSIIIIVSDVRIKTLGGLLGIEELNYLCSFIVTLFSFILIINSYNLIDGIDGLAGIIGVLISGFFGLYFYFNTVLYLAILSFSLFGSLLGFLKFNLSTKEKIFMGDTGSMIVGFLLSFLSVKFLNSNYSDKLLFKFNNPEIIVVALLFYPMLDTCRIFFVRKFIYKTNPFCADKNHIHHKLLQLYPKHADVAKHILFSNLAVLFVAVITPSQEINTRLFLIALTGIAAISVPFIKQRMFPFFAKRAY